MPIADEFDREVGRTRYPKEHETKRPLRLSAIVDPKGTAPFAVIEHEQSGLALSYRVGSMLRPGVLPGVWVVGVEAGVVHLLDLEDRSFEYLTFSKPRRYRPGSSSRARSKARTRSKSRGRRR